MTQDAMFILDLLVLRRDSLRNTIYTIKMPRDRITKFTYYIFSIEQTLSAIYEYDEGCVSASVIYNILKYQVDEYDRYYRNEQGRFDRFKDARDMANDFLKITGGYLYE